MAVVGLSGVSDGNFRPCFMLGVILVILAFDGFQVGSPSQATARGASLTEWTVPTFGSGPWGLALDSSGTCCWFVEYYGNKLGHFDSRSGVFQEWTIPTGNSNPYSVAVTSVAGNTMVWGTEFASDKVFEFSPASGNFSEFSVRSGGGAAYVSIEPGPGLVRVWFTQPSGDANGEFIYDPASGNVTDYEDSFPAPVGGGAYVVRAFSGLVWFAGFTSIVRWDRSSGEYTIWPLPTHNGTVGRSITFDSLGQLWYTQGTAYGLSNDNFVGVLEGNVIREWRIPGMGANPRGISIDPLTQRPWIADQSSLVGNGTVANLIDFGNSSLFLSSPVTAPSAAIPTVLSPTVTHVTASVHSAISTIGPVVASGEGPFAAYGLGSSLPTDVIVDSSGDVWASEPAANKIVRLSPVTPDYALSPPTSVLSLAQGSSVPVSVTAVSVSGYVGDVTFAAPSVPAGITVSGFNPNPVHVLSGSNVSSNFEISIAPNALPGIDLITVEANDGTTIHTIGLALMITNSTTTIASQQLETRCLVTVPVYIPQSTLLVSLLADVFIGSFYVGLPLEYFSRRLHPVRGLSRRSWLIVLLFVPTLFAVGSVLLLVC